MGALTGLYERSSQARAKTKGGRLRKRQRARLSPIAGARDAAGHLGERSLREPCSSAEGGGGARSILAYTDRPVRANRARGTTSAFVESDRRELPRAGERSGDDPALRRRRRQLTLCHVGTRPGLAVRTMALRGMRSCRGSKPDKSFRPVTSRARSCAMATFRYPAVRSVRFEGRDRFRVNPRGRPSRRCTAGSSESPQACIVRGSRRPCGCIRNILGDPRLTILRTGADLAGLARDRSSRRLISRARGAARYFPPTGRPSAGRSVRLATSSSRPGLL